MVIVAEMAVDLWKGRVDRLIDRRLSTWCDRLVGNSHAVVEFYKNLGVPQDRLAMIYSGMRMRNLRRSILAWFVCRWGLRPEPP